MKFLDRGSISKAVTDAISGFLRAPATLTRTGVFHYAPPGEKPFSVLRLPEEVFSDASMKSFDLVPVVDDHPYSEPDSKITTENARRLQVGSVGAPRRNGDLLEALVCITDAAMIEKIHGGKVQLSCGYFADAIPAEPGAMFEGVPYDFIQRNIRGNHLAICDVARAGEVARLHLDSAVEVDQTLTLAERTAQQITSTQKKQGKKIMEKIFVDGVQIEVDATAASVIAKHHKATGEILAASQTEIAGLKVKVDKAQAVCDSGAAEIVTLKAEVAKLSAPAFLASKIAERVEVEKLATKHGITADGKDLITVKREVIGKLNPSIKLDGKSADYVEAFFDSMTTAPAGNVVTDAAELLLKNAGASAVVPVLDADTKRKNFNAAIFSADASKATV